MPVADLIKKVEGSTHVWVWVSMKLGIKDVGRYVRVDKSHLLTRLYEVADKYGPLVELDEQYCLDIDVWIG